jgi:hypothetical protein
MILIYFRALRTTWQDGTSLTFIEPAQTTSKSFATCFKQMAYSWIQTTSRREPWYGFSGAPRSGPPRIYNVGKLDKESYTEKAYHDDPVSLSLELPATATPAQASTLTQARASRSILATPPATDLSASSAFYKAPSQSEYINPSYTTSYERTGTPRQILAYEQEPHPTATEPPPRPRVLMSCRRLGYRSTRFFLLFLIFLQYRRHAATLLSDVYQPCSCVLSHAFSRTVLLWLVDLVRRQEGHIQQLTRSPVLWALWVSWARLEPVDDVEPAKPDSEPDLITQIRSLLEDGLPGIVRLGKPHIHEFISQPAGPASPAAAGGSPWYCSRAIPVFLSWYDSWRARGAARSQPSSANSVVFSLPDYPLSHLPQDTNIVRWDFPNSSVNFSLLFFFLLFDRVVFVSISTIDRIAAFMHGNSLIWLKCLIFCMG